MRNRHAPWFSDYRSTLEELERKPLEVEEVLTPATVIMSVKLAAESAYRFEFASTIGRDVGGYFDRKLRPLSLWRWSQLNNSPDYTRVALTHLADCWVSTIWGGASRLSPRLVEGPHRIFASAVFHGEYFYDGIAKGRIETELPDMYSSEREALAGHEAIVREQQERLARVS